MLIGLAQGATSTLLAKEIRSTEKTLRVFDSFKGLGKPSEKGLLIDDIFNLGTIDQYEGKMIARVEEVEFRLKAISFQSNTWVYRRQHQIHKFAREGMFRLRRLLRRLRFLPPYFNWPKFLKSTWS
jgi:hypothetical protein